MAGAAAAQGWPGVAPPRQLAAAPHSLLAHVTNARLRHQPVVPLHACRHVARAAATDGPADVDRQAEATPPTVQQLEAAAHDAAAFATALEALAQRGGGGGATEAHVVAAWAAQRHSPALHVAPGSAREAHVLRALAALERLTQRHLVALTADQLGFVFRCYLLAGGSDRRLLQGMQQAACGWRADDFSAAGLAELAWALASSSVPAPDGCRRLLRDALGAEEQRQGQEQGQQQGQQDQQQQQQPGVPPRDWAAWFEGTPASRVVLLLWAAGRLGCKPCPACMQAAAAQLLRPDGGLSALPSKSLVTLLWALATLRAEQQVSLARAVSRLLGERLEAALGGEPREQEELAGAPKPALGMPSLGDASSSMLGSAAEAAAEEEDEQALVHGAAPPGDAPPASGDSLSGDSWHSESRSNMSADRSSSNGAAALQATPTEPGLHTGALSTVVWACGQLRHADPRLLHGTSALLQERVDELAAADVGRVLWGLAQLGHCPAGLLAALAERLQAPGVLAGFDARQLAVLSYSFVALDFFPGQCCVDAVADAALAAAPGFARDPRALASLLWNMSRLGYVDEPFYAAWAPAILGSIGEYGPRELADVARVYARAALNPEREAGGDGGGGGGGSLFDALAAQTVARMREAELQDVLRIMTAFHQMGLQPEELLGAVEGWANRRLRALPPQALSLALWSFARMGAGRPGLLDTAVACAEQRLGAFTPGQLAKVAWALSKLRWPAPRVLRHAGAQLAGATAAFSDKDASNVLWALASQGEAPPAADLDAIAANLQPRLPSFGPQSLANIAWAYATLRHAPPQPFLRHLAAAARPRLRAFEPQGVSLLVWALASLGCRADALLADIVALSIDSPGLLHQFEGQHLANLLWGLCRTGFRPATPFLQLMEEEAELRVCDLKPQELFNVAWSFAQLGHHPARLFDAVAHEVAPRAFAFSPQELSGTLWALAKAGHATRATAALLDAVEHEVSARAAVFEPRHLAIVAWSAGRLGRVLRPAALQAALGALRPGALQGRSLATLVEGLAAMERLRQAEAARQQQQPGEQPGGQREQLQQQASHAEGSSGGGVQLAPSPLVPPPLLDELAERAVAVLPGLQPFEFAQLALGFAVLGSPLAARLLLRSPGAAARAALADAARRAPVPDVVGLLWALARCGCCEGAGFECVAVRLRRTSPQYRLTPATLALLGEALELMSPRQAVALALRSGLRRAALAAAAQPRAAAVAAGAAGADDTGSGSDSGEEGRLAWAATPWVVSSGGLRRKAAAMAAPRGDSDDEDATPLDATYESEDEWRSLP